MMRHFRAPWVFRPLNVYESDWELIVLAVGSCAGLLGLIWMGFGLLLPGCTFLALTGLPCLTCGGTRAVQAILSGDIMAAAGWNPGVTAGLLLLGGFYCYSLYAVCAGRRRLRCLPGAVPGWSVRTCAVVLLLGNWIYVAQRLE